MTKIFRYIGLAFKWFWYLLSFARQLVLNLVFAAILVTFVAILSQLLSTDKTASVISKKPKALLVDLSGPIVEKRQSIAPFDFASRNLFSQLPAQENLLFEIVDRVRTAAKDDKINGMILELTNLPETSLTKLRYIAKALNEFKAAGKKIVATGGHYSQSQYYLASYADEVFMAPDGAVLLQGYGSYHLYYKELLEKLNITTHIFRVGEYKSAVEPYTRSDMSEQARSANSVWLNHLWGAYIHDVARNRKIQAKNISLKEKQLIALMQEVKGDSALLAKKLGLVDRLYNRTQARAKLIEYFGSDGEDGANHVSIYDYNNINSISSLSRKNQIAVVVASGVIVDGMDDENQIGADTTAALLRKARLDDNIKAVVLRIDSPGGSAFASEVIRNEFEEIKKMGKPIVASMSSVAASGGYWIASSADKIIAQPTTITGSIGIFGMLTTFDKVLAKYGIYNDGLGTTPLSGVGLTREFPNFATQLMQLGIENGYQRFVTLVSEQRAIPIDEVNKIANGRVWTGADAIKHRLVDQLGDFDDAITAAAKLAKLDFYKIHWMQEPLNPAHKLFLELFSETMVKLGIKNQATLPQPLEKLALMAEKAIKQLSSFNDPNGRYAMCSECLIY